MDQKIVIIPKQTKDEEKIKLKPALSLKELCEAEFPDIKWAIEGLFESGTINMISAAPNHFKTWIVHHMAICLALGEPVFGHFTTDKQSVLIINEEDTLRMLQERSMMLTSTTDDINVFFYVGEGLKLSNQFVDALLLEIKTKCIRFVIFDSFRSIHLADENDSTGMQVVMNLLKRIAREGITVLLAHHNRKKPLQPSTNRTDLSEDARGSSAISGALHGHISCEPIEKDGKQCLLLKQQKLKCAKKIQPFLLEINVDESRFGFTYLGEHHLPDNMLNKVKTSILAELNRSGKWLSVKDLLTFRIGSEQTMRTALGMLAKDGQIQSKERKELISMSAPMISPTGKHNEKMYHISCEGKADESLRL